MEYYNGILCISGSELICSDENPDGLISEGYYKKLQYKGRLNVLRRGCYGTPALIEYDSVPIKYRRQFEEMHGDPHRMAEQTPFKELVRTDDKALAFYSTYLLSTGDNLPEKVIREYSTNAAVMNAISDYVSNKKALRKSLGMKTTNQQIWSKVAEIIHEDIVTASFRHTLPKNPAALQRRYRQYLNEGYEALIHSGFCNNNSLKVSTYVEKLILSLYTMPQKPFGADVHDLYNMFVNGKMDVYDRKTGEVFDRRFLQKDGAPLELSKATVWNYINIPDNRAVVDSKRNDSLYYKRTHRPHHHRHNPNFSFSKISMDDRDLPRKLHSGERVKAYYAYDVASGCVIGRAYSKTKDGMLFLDTLRDMLRTIYKYGLPMPGEVEVEHHIVNHFKEELDMMFSIVRWCNPGNSQEKHAEQLNRAKKYQTEKKNHSDIGRWWAKSEAYLIKSKREGDEYKYNTYDYDILVAEDIADINEYNNALHKNQKKYPGMTRWQVLLDHINSDLAQPSDALVCKCIGDITETTIRNNQYVRVQYADYILPSPAVINRLKPNNYKVDAYWLANENGGVDEVYLYQDGRFICKCGKIEEYNTARVEWTDKDAKAFTEQSSYVSQFDKQVKDRKADLASIGIISHDTLALAQSATPEVVEVRPDPESSFEETLQQLRDEVGDISQRALREL